MTSSPALRQIDVADLETPVGRLSLLASDDVLVAAGFCDPAPLLARLGGGDVRERTDLGGLSKAMSAYLDGDVDALADVPVQQRGTTLQTQAWDAMRAIPPGQTVSYGALAAQLGVPGASRAVGSACGRNLVAPVVPCHRVVRSDGSHGGYEYGLTVKAWLLRHERAARSSMTESDNEQH